MTDWANPGSISYGYYINGKVISLVIKESIDGGYDFYKVYNIDIETGEKITNKELLQYKGFSISEFTNELPNIYGDYFKKLCGNYKEDDFYIDQYNKTISGKNCNIEQPIFIDWNGKINIVAKIYQLAGGESPYSHIICVNDALLNNEQNNSEKDKNLTNNIINKTLNFNENAEYKNMTEISLKENEGLYITSIEKTSDKKISIKGVKFEEYSLSSEEVEKLKHGATIMINGQEYYYKENSLVTNKNGYAEFSLSKNNDKYILNTNTEWNVTRKMTEEYLTLTLEQDVKYIEYDVWNEEKEFAENLEFSIEEFCNKFTYSEPKDETHPSGLYGFNFENGKCIEVYYMQTGV